MNNKHLICSLCMFCFSVVNLAFKFVVTSPSFTQSLRLISDLVSLNQNSHDWDFKQPKVSGRARRGSRSRELLVKHGGCQTGEYSNTSVIIVTPSSPRFWAGCESSQRLFSGLVPSCPYCFNTPQPPIHKPLHSNMLSVGCSFLPFSRLNDDAAAHELTAD